MSSRDPRIGGALAAWVAACTCATPTATRSSCAPTRRHDAVGEQPAKVGVGVNEREAYLDRLGLDVEPPSVDALFQVHRAHVERVAYETLWIHLGEGWSVDPADSVERVARGRRGGYCFHLNGAMSELLRGLGYDV